MDDERPMTPDELAKMRRDIKKLEDSYNPEAEAEGMAQQYIHHEPEHRGCAFAGPEVYHSAARRVLRESRCKHADGTPW